MKQGWLQAQLDVGIQMKGSPRLCPFLVLCCSGLMLPSGRYNPQGGGAASGSRLTSPHPQSLFPLLASSLSWLASPSRVSAWSPGCPQTPGPRSRVPSSHRHGSVWRWVLTLPCFGATHKVHSRESPQSRLTVLIGPAAPFHCPCVPHARLEGDTEAGNSGRLPGGGWLWVASSLSRTEQG